MHDLRGVLGVDHLGPAGHRHHIVDQQRAQHQKQRAIAGLDHAALLQADDHVVRDAATMGVELRARSEGDGVVTPLGVGELNTFADVKRAGR